MTFSEEQIAIRDMTRAVVRDVIAPGAPGWDRAGKTPEDVFARLGALGLFGVTVPERWGGAGADFLSYILMTEELARGDAGICNAVNATNAFCLRMLEFATDAQRDEFLRPIAQGEGLACMLLTEPQAGSDASNLRTRAVRRGDRYVVNGEKCFITSGRSARHAILIAVTDPDAGRRGISAFLIRPGATGYKVVREEEKMGHRTSETCQISLEDFEVPVANRIGAEGDGLKVAFAGLESGRIGVAAQAVGIARAAMAASVRYARERVAFGKPIIEHQAVAFQLAEAATELEASVQLCLAAARLKNAGARCAKEASMAKLFATRMVERVCSVAMQVHGGYGYISDFPVEKLYLDARVLQVYDGTNEVQKMLIARALSDDR
jgi:butyryl-CoA dehydrogenase